MNAQCRRPFSTGAPLLFLFAVACSDEGLAFTPPFIATSADTLDFGEIKIGLSDQRTIFLLNKGQRPLTIELPRYDSSNDVFGMQLDGFIVEPSKDTVLAIRFRPAHAVTYTTTVTLMNDSSNRPELTLLITGTGVNPAPCDGVECRRAPPPTCISESTTRRYEPLGMCEETTGNCIHPFRDDSCMFGCDDTTGACRGDPCIGLACDVPPNGCYFANGECVDGACRFEVNNAGVCNDNSACTTGDHCAEGSCVGVTTECNAAPDAFCVDSSTRRTFNAQGACNPATGGCDYAQQDQHCDFGCSGGLCVGDPCAGIVCNTPPSTQCYQAAGTCSMGVCQYTTVAGACDDGSLCTTGDTCNNGLCQGAATTCNAAPAPDCANATDRRVYNAVGMCNPANGQCEYTANQAACDDFNACTTGDRCMNGMCTTSGMQACNDGNPCTTDSCDPVAGCRATGISGPACTTSSGECPTGQCSAGSCISVANINCQAEYEVCFGAFDIDVPGRCSASGQCVVTQPPPQFTCPGCNGLCIQCAFVQLCLPF